jgi:hypothetical protein
MYIEAEEMSFKNISLKETDEMTNLFVTSNNDEVSNNGNQLEKSAQLTTQANGIANDILKALDAVSTEDKARVEDLVKASMTDHDVMDELINELVDLQFEKISYLQEESESTIDKMIKSQQSKRSRSKGKLMTMDNYRTMLIGAVAENLLRLAANKPKSAIGAAAHGQTSYSEEELTKLSMNKEDLAKAIRNIQSKKSIAKSKAGFTVESDKWQALLVAETQLKALRGESTTTVTIVDTKLKDELTEKLTAAGDITSLKATDAKALLASLMELIQPTKSDETAD